MALTIKEWKKSEDFQRLTQVSQKDFFEKEFMRNPFRSISIDNNIVKSPTDGVLLYIGTYDANNSILEIKGKRYTIKDILFDKSIEGTFYVAGIFLTSFSVHVVRASVSGIITRIMHLPPLTTANISMTLFEIGIFNEMFVKDALYYNFYNQRTVIEQYVPHWNTYVYYVLIADYEVDHNLLYVKDWDVVRQGERIAYVCFGSQVDILIRKKVWMRSKKLLDEHLYVFAGEDELFRIYNKYYSF